jgi:hypothetical protein
VQVRLAEAREAPPPLELALGRARARHADGARVKQRKGVVPQQGVHSGGQRLGALGDLVGRDLGAGVRNRRAGATQHQSIIKQTANNHQTIIKQTSNGHQANIKQHQTNMKRTPDPASDNNTSTTRKGKKHSSNIEKRKEKKKKKPVQPSTNKRSNANRKGKGLAAFRA